MMSHFGRLLALTFVLLSATLFLPERAAGQSVRVHPDGVNVNSNGPTVVFLTFGPLLNRVPAEVGFSAGSFPHR